MAEARRWSRLAPASRRRWIAEHGGPRSLGHEAREQRARAAYERGEHLERLGHEELVEPRGVVLLTAQDGVVRLTGTDLSRQDLRRAAVHLHAARHLAEVYDNSDKATWERAALRFRRRFRRWQPVAGYRLSADPAAVLAMVEMQRAARDEGRVEVFAESGKTRSGRRRRR